jgi:parallel beta-helix repeat protein
MESKKGSLVVMFLVIVSVFSVTLTVIPKNAEATFLYVGGVGPGNYTTIQSAINAANVGDTIFVYNGTYVESIMISKSLQLLGEHRNTTVIDGAGSNYVARIQANSVTISGFSVTNGSMTGILMEGSASSEISNNNISDNTDQGLVLLDSPFNTIASNIITNNTDMVGIIVFASPGSTIANNNISGSHGGVDIYDDDGSTVNGNSISNTIFGIGFGNSLNGRVMNNNLFSNELGIDIAESESLITGNRISGSTIGIDLKNVNFTTLRNNVMSGGGVLLRGNTAWHWNTQTIDTSNIVNGKPVYYWKNTVGGAVPPGAGQVILGNCFGVEVENQNISNVFSGIQVGFGNGNTIINNTVFSNSYSGISLSTTNSNTIVGNNASSNTYYGILLDSSSDNTIINNTIWFNGVNGAYLLPFSDGNRIYHNYFMNNGVQQARDSALGNLWDNGYPSGGNFWSDYSETDIYRGPRQDAPGSDGIGDAPYYMWIRSQDRYPLVSPGTVFPTPPSNIESILSGSGLENVTLSWDLSPDEAKGSVKEYRVLRGDAYSSIGNLYTLIGSVSNGTKSFVDVLAGVGDSSSYFYIACAVNATDNLTCADNQAGKFTRPLSKGPNLISIPLIQSDETIQTVLQTVSYDNAWSYDSINQEWRSSSISKPYAQSLEYLNHTMGIWVNVTQNSNLTVAGVVPTSTTIDLQAGWNLVGFPSFDDNFTVADLKATVGVERIEGFDGLRHIS